MFIGTENRVFERLDKELAVRYSPQGTDGEFCTITKNISGGGARLLLLKALKPGTVLDLEISKYNSNITIRCRGKIVWVWDTARAYENEHSFEAGVQFMEPELVPMGRLLN